MWCSLKCQPSPHPNGLVGKGKETAALSDFMWCGCFIKNVLNNVPMCGNYVLRNLLQSEFMNNNI